MFFNHQHYRIAVRYVQTYVVNGAEKNRPRLLVDLHLPMGGEIYTGLFFVYSPVIFEVVASLLYT